MSLTDEEVAVLRVELAQLTRLDSDKTLEIEQTAKERPELLPTILANYADQDWADPSTPAGQRFLAIVSALSGLAGEVGSVAGAAGAVKGL